MKQTEKYQLNQWELTDRIQMEDFNNNNLKIEAALEGVTALCNCQIHLQTYTGTGTAGPVTHTFPHRPMFIMILSNAGGTWVFSARGTKTISGRMGVNTYVETPITWGDKSVTIGTESYSSSYCLNGSSGLYCMVALLDAAN